jgi:hypothetical protein
LLYEYLLENGFTNFIEIVLVAEQVKQAIKVGRID